MSAHGISIIEISNVLPHDNAERLEIVPIGGWQAIVKKGQFIKGDRAIYIEPDYTVPTSREEFSFLAKEGRDRHRLKAVRLRGVLSYGLLIPVPVDLQHLSVGSDVMEALQIERYDPPIKLGNSDELAADQWPNIYVPKFDVESLQKFPDVIKIGEMVIVTEKIHGANARYLWLDGIFYMGSRTRWLKSDINHEWRRASDSDSRIQVWCQNNPGVVLYGEIYGSIQSLKYGAKSGEIRFAAFAAIYQGEWINVGNLISNASLPAVPLVYCGPYNPDIILPLAEQDSTVYGAENGHMREGIVIVPLYERRDEQIGRVALKSISNRYWESAN
jgi:RNA ligase (TIGR02306 family)